MTLNIYSGRARLLGVSDGYNMVMAGCVGFDDPNGSEILFLSQALEINTSHNDRVVPRYPRKLIEMPVGAHVYLGRLPRYIEPIGTHGPT